MASPKLIVFGPTGDIASAAAVTARRLGAHVVLAMRNPSKPIPGLTAELEAQGGFERVRADLGDPDSVAAAVATTGAKRAIFYVNFASTDGMLATVRALSNAGIDFPILISSASVHNRGVSLEELAVSVDEPIARIHAAVEVSLRTVYGPGGYVALRPGYFASNSLRWLGRGALASGRVTLDFPERVYDWIVPADIGRVAAHVALRAGGAREVVAEAGGSEAIVLMGPRTLSGREGTLLIARAAGFGEVEIDEIVEVEAAVRHIVEKQGVPEFIARTLAEHGIEYAMTEENTTVGPANIVKFGDGKTTSLEEWAAAHKEAFN